MEGKDRSEQTTEQRNLVLGILAHVDAGKTTLSELLLYRSGSIRTLGRVDHGSSFMDTDALERERGITIFSKQAQLSFHGRKLTLIDTPGHVDFSAEMERCLQILDLAILVVSAPDGLQGHTRTLWRLLAQYGIPVFIFVNKMDQPAPEKEQILQQLRQGLSEECLDFSQPGQWDEHFYETIAMTDEDMLELVLSGQRPEDEDIARLIARRKIFPVYFGSALKDQGVEALIEGILRFAPAPSMPDVFGARIFKVTHDAQGNRLVHMKITGGSLRVKGMLSSANWEKEEKVNQIRVYNGDKYEVVQEADAGCICAVTGLTQAMPGEGIGMENEKISPQLEPVLAYRLLLPDQPDIHTVLSKMRILEEENPELHLVWNEELSQLHIQLMGEVQMEVLKNRIQEQFGWQVEFGEGDVVYRETIREKVEGVGHFEPLRHYAEVHLLMEPLKRGSGLVFESSCREDMLSRNWQRLILTHLREKEHVGVLTGAPITDMKIALVSGRAHIKHTEGGDFRQAVYRAIRHGLMHAETILLEPYYSFRAVVPSEMAGRVLADVERMCGTFRQPLVKDQIAWISGRAPVSTMQNYAKEMASFTHGKGSISLMPAGYDICHNPEEVILKKQYDPSHDLDNPADSVFCGHGAGFVVPWDEVTEHMHLPPVLSGETQDEAAMERARRSGEEAQRKKQQPMKFGQEEAQLKEIFERTYGVAKERTAPGSRVIGAKNSSDTNPTEKTVRKNKKQAQNTEEYLLVDGYNIIFAWDELRELAEVNIDAARGKLMDILCDYQGFKKCRVIVVFDAYKVKGGLGVMQKYHNIEVVYTKEAETADQYIAKAACGMNGGNYRVTVATSDGMVQLIVWGQGCFLMSARELKLEIEHTKQLLRENFLNKPQKGTNYMRDVMQQGDLEQHT